MRCGAAAAPTQRAVPPPPTPLPRHRCTDVAPPCRRRRAAAASVSAVSAATDEVEEWEAGARSRAACATELVAALLPAARNAGARGRPRDAAPDDDAGRGALTACVRPLLAPAAPASVLRLAASCAAARTPAAARAAFRRAAVAGSRAVPDCEGARAAGCQLGSDSRAAALRSAAVARHVASVFTAVAVGSAAHMREPLVLSRFCLYHGHMFVRPAERALGLLLHALEYPSRESLDRWWVAAGGEGCVHLGRCQEGSPVEWRADAAALRNALYLVAAPPLPARPGRGKRKRASGAPAGGGASALALLYTGEGAPLRAELVAPWARDMNTVDEADMGWLLADVMYLHALPHVAPEHRVFVNAR